MIKLRVKKLLIIICLIIFSFGYIYTFEKDKPLVLQEITWKDVEQYLKKCDMVIIPIGSTEQHGPHMPLGTDYYEALETSKLISARTGVLVAPVLLSGYSVYHSGFPGTLSLKSETIELVLFETVEILMKYGFRKFMFFNYHGGNRIAESNVILRINHTTEAIAVQLGIGAPFQKRTEQAAPFDFHAGISETSTMLYLKPELVKMDLAEKPKITFSPQMQELWELGQKNPGLMTVWNSLLATPSETKKKGASHEISNNGIWSFGDPKTATKAMGRKIVNKMVENAVKFINDWKKIKSK